MASSDEEGEIVPRCVTDYYIVDHNEKPVSLDSLPIQWSRSEAAAHHPQGSYFLVGTAEDDSLQKVYKSVVAWRFDLSFLHPELSVLSKGMDWISLQKPRKRFEDVSRTLFVTLHWLHFLKKSPDTSVSDLWNYLLKSFRSFSVEPCGKDLYVHMSLITEAVKRDKDLAKCKNSLLLMEKPKENPNEYRNTAKKTNFIVDTDDYCKEDEKKDEFGGDEGLYDHVCALCDNGGEILCCQGRCMRSFHATVSSGDGYCESLGYLDAQVKAMPTFLCPNCKYQQHQCFACGELGSSDNSTGGAVVFPCISATCGHFYHPKCATKLIEPANESQAEELQARISAGESFTCPVHKCSVCKKGEEKKVPETQFAVCRRCPKTYHRKCLPRIISFDKNSGEGISQRAWEDLLPNRILIYCMNHEIDSELETPARDHIKFPAIKGQETAQSHKQRIRISFKSLPNLPKRVEKREIQTERSNPTSTITKSSRETFGSGSQKFFSTIKKSSKENVGLGSKSQRHFSTTQGTSRVRRNISIGSKRYPAISKLTIPRQVTEVPAIKKNMGSSSNFRVEIENRILALMKESDSSFNRAEFLKKRKLPATYEMFSLSLVDNTITRGKVEGSVKAIRTALRKLDEGCSIEDTKAVCEPEVLRQFFYWKMKLQLYLTPFLHGMRYTSFGRHFTKVDKLREVVDRLHNYVENGDTIVDFCCGSNDFSVMMKDKLEKTGKKCCFKNFDLIVPKIDFNFEQRDWMSIKLEELPHGSQLIMGLNPPFGVNAALANKFIYKALQFKPKLLILIVPSITKRLDQTGFPYDLIWEDQTILSGKSFYLPGSVDANNKQLEDWNLKPPPLYLWSHRDWTARHKYIAKVHGHSFQPQSMDNVNNNPTEESHGCYHDDSSLHTSGDLFSMSDEYLDDNDEYYPDESDANLQEYDGGVESEYSNQGSTGDMCIDMEISSPARSPPTCSEALYEAFGTPETDNGFRTGKLPNMDLPSPTPPEPDYLPSPTPPEPDQMEFDHGAIRTGNQFVGGFSYQPGTSYSNFFTYNSGFQANSDHFSYNWASHQYSYAPQSYQNVSTQECIEPKGGPQMHNNGSPTTIDSPDLVSNSGGENASGNNSYVNYS